MGATKSCQAPNPAQGQEQGSVTDTMHGWPGQNNTGPSKWALAHGNWKTESGTVLKHSGTYSFIHFQGEVDIAAQKIRLVNDTVTGSDDILIGIEASKYYISRVTVSGNDSGSGRCGAGIKDHDGSGSIRGTINRVNVFWCSTGVQDIAGVLENSWIHDPGFQNGDHLNGETQNGDGTPLLIEHNRIINNSPQGQTDAIGLYCDFGTEANVEIINNYLDGGGYALYGGESGEQGPCKTGGGMVATGNVFGHSSAHGPVAYWDTGSGNVWGSDNKFVNGKAVTP